jgi:RNA polymerase subunit RPABC4/transcription elongation factor Spt4
LEPKIATEEAVETWCPECRSEDILNQWNRL